jgi:hypothetical protein
VSDTRSPVEVTTRYVTTVDDLPAAWAFVMSKIDAVGPDPEIAIEPVWSQPFDAPLGDDSWPRHFSVVVSGMVEAAEGKP